MTSKVQLAPVDGIAIFVSLTGAVILKGLGPAAVVTDVNNLTIITREVQAAFLKLQIAHGEYRAEATATGNPQSRLFQ